MAKNENGVQILQAVEESDHFVIGIHGYFGQRNRGDDAILKSMISNIEKVTNYPTFFVFSSYPKRVDVGDNIHGVDDHVSNLRNLISLFHSINCLDILIIGGGGLFFDSYDRFIPRDIIRWSKLAFIARLLRKPVLGYGLGLGPISGKFGRCIAKFTLNNFHSIVVRDPQSQELLSELNVTKPKIIRSADLAILLDRPTTPSKRIEELIATLPQNRPLVGLSIRDCTGLIDGPESLYLRLAEIADDLIDAGVHPVFIPFGFGKVTDGIAALNISKLMKNKSGFTILPVDHLLTVDELLTLFWHFDFHICMRLHSAIFSAIAGKPFIALSYDPKVRQFANGIGMNEYCIDINDLSREEVRSKFDSLMKNQYEVSRTINKKVLELRNSVLENSSIVVKILLERK